MPVYNVIRKSDGQQVYRYNADAPVEWDGMEFATHDHVEHVEVAPDGVIEGTATVVKRRLTKLEFIDRLGDAAYLAILTMAKVSVEVEAFVKRFEMATPEADGTSVDLDDPRTVAGVTTLGAALEAQGVVAAGWAQGVLNG